MFFLELLKQEDDFPVFEDNLLPVNWFNVGNQSLLSPYSCQVDDTEKASIGTQQLKDAVVNSKYVHG